MRYPRRSVTHHGMTHQVVQAHVIVLGMTLQALVHHVAQAGIVIVLALVRQVLGLVHQMILVLAGTVVLVLAIRQVLGIDYDCISRISNGSGSCCDCR